MYESNKKISGHQNLSKISNLTGQDMAVFVFKTQTERAGSKGLTETNNRLMNRLLQEATVVCFKDVPEQALILT